jgi:hypothetical protein
MYLLEHFEAQASLNGAAPPILKVCGFAHRIVHGFYDLGFKKRLFS